MPINQFNDYPWERREARRGAADYEQRMNDRWDHRTRLMEEVSRILDQDDGYREWCETIEKQEEQDENAR